MIIKTDHCYKYVVGKSRTPRNEYGTLYTALLIMLHCFVLLCIDN